MKKTYLFFMLSVLGLMSCSKETELARVNTALPTLLEVQAGATTSSVIVGGIIVNNGGSTVTDQGIFWGTTAQPDEKITIPLSSDGITFSITKDNVEIGSVFYYRAYITTAEGTFLGSLQQISQKPVKPLFPESFDGEVFPPAGWSLIDHDGDGYCWAASWSSRLSVGAMSDSYSAEGEALSPYNFLISPKITLGEGAVLSWYVGSTANNAVAEKYKIVLSTTGTNFESFPDQNIVFLEILTKADSRVYNMRSVDLSAYAGQSVYIAFVHFDCYDQDSMVIKEINVSSWSVAND